jgi:hypothetical protein
MTPLAVLDEFRYAVNRPPFGRRRAAENDSLTGIYR